MRTSIGFLGLGAILLLSFGLMLSVSLQEAAIVDEMAHIPAGYGYVKYFDYRLNPEHPPLVKMLAGLPLTFMQLNFPLDRPSWQNDINGQWAAGYEFLYLEGNDADEIIQWARVGPIILTLFLVAFVYLWSKELLGPRWALLPTVFTAFSPTILAHGHYVTTDIGAALGVIVSLYFFVRFLIGRSRKNIIFAGLAFGFAQLLKFSAVILVPYFLILAALYWGINKRWDPRAAWRLLRSAILVLLIGLIFIYPFYFITTLNYPIERQTRDTDFILQSFANGPPAQGEACSPMRCLAEFNIWMAEKPLLRPFAEYLLGILMVIQRSAGGNTIYFLDGVSASGSALYFPMVYLIKEALPLLILSLTALLYALYRGMQKVRPRLPELSMMLFILIYTIYSITSPLNIGVRHLLPIMPLIYILTAVGLKSAVQETGNPSLPRFRRASRKLALVGIGLLTLWFLISVGRAYPYYLSYFNEAVGIDNGWRYVTDSNYDWGQDLKKLQVFVENEKINKIAVDYFGGGSIEYYLNQKGLRWESGKGNPREQGIEWLAVSVNTLQLAKGELRNGEQRKPENEYQWLQDYEEPYARAGKSIFIYKLN